MEETKHNEVTNEEIKESAKAVTPKKPKTVKKNEPYKVKVDVLNLNIRKGPGSNFEKTGKFTGKGEFTIAEVSEGQGSKSGWGKLESGTGWICLDYTTKL